MTTRRPDAPARIIDANANRAREALRVLEDAARFALDDEPLARTLKEMRHELRAVLEAAGFDDARRLASRDTPGDVGTRISTPEEASRTGLADIASAGAKRLSESLRAIEECLKTQPARPTDGAMPAARVESLRYRSYEVERALVGRLRAEAAPPRPPAPQWRLCVLITEALCENMPWDRLAAECLDAGADCLQLREKSLADRELLARARRLVDLARERAPRASVIINDRPDIALLAGAAGVHLGQDDMPVAEARRIVGEDLLIGISTTDVQQARRAAHDGADTIGIGPMFPSGTKAKPSIAGPGTLASVLGDPVAGRLPHLAIGGIGPENIREVVQAGGRGVAVCACVAKKMQRPAVVCRALLEELSPKT